ncbi:MAG: DUF6519 domain-containing protein [Pyrinomonadaceae bacterium]
MKGDFSRQTFARRNHYSGVRMQQGRVQLDADWNEQADITAHRARVTTRDIIGGCGGPLKNAAFKVRPLPRRLEPPRPEPEDRPVIDPSGVTPIRLPRRVVTNVGDFFLGAGRYYVDGILCENEREVRYSEQPDFPEATTLGDAPFDDEALYLLYLDVWERHLTALDAPHIRETALGGPDTATRTKTVWQAKLWKVPRAGGVVCPDVFGAFMRTEVGRNTGLLNASSVPEDPGSNPCIVPPSAGYRGLENLLYRVEVHAGGPAADVSTNAGGFAVASFDQRARNQLTLAPGLTPRAGDAVELYATRSGSDPMAGGLYFVTDISGQTLTLDRDIQGIELAQQPRLRVATATFKWSRHNGSVVTKIETISSQDSKQISVQSLGPDDDLGFSDGDWVELTDDLTELHGQPGQLTQIVSADNATRAVVLKDAPTVITSRNAKMRRWDGIGSLRTNPSDADRNWVTIENGLRIQFTPRGADGSGPGVYATGDYWLIPTRTATADRESGQIEWPLDQAGRPEPQTPAGIAHHYCPLALLEWDKRRGVTVTHDCRHLFPPVTELSTLHYVSGTGQEAMPVLAPPAQSLVELLHPLVVGVSNGGVPVADARVVFEVVEGEINEAGPEGEFPNGRLSPVAGGSAVVISNTKIEVRTDEAGLAACKWELSTGRWNQQVVATLLGEDLRTPIHLPVRFNANLSVASEVAYKPGKCDRLANFRTVQDALDELCRIVGLGAEPGVKVTDINFGARRESPSTLRDNIENDFDLVCDVLAEGLQVTCDRDIFPDSVKGKPTCFVTLELPFPFSESDREALGVGADERGIIGYQPIVLDGEAVAEGSRISWSPTRFAGNWLSETFNGLFANIARLGLGSPRQGRVLSRLTLKGNFIWSLRDPSLYLDGDLFGVAGEGVTAALSPSGDGKRGGDLELWFWLVQFEVRLDRSDLNVGATTKGRVVLSGPAPPQGSTIQLAVADAGVATLGRRSVSVRGGQTEAEFDVTAVGEGQTTITASYAGGERAVVLRAQRPAPLKVRRVRVLNSGAAETVFFESREGSFNANVALGRNQRPNVIEIEFTGGPVNQESVRDGATFLVRRLVTGGVPAVQSQTGTLSWTSASVVRWTAARPLAAGNYSVALLGGRDPVVNVATADNVKAADGRTLDGEPRQLPSGDNSAGGTFAFTMQVT